MEFKNILEVQPEACRKPLPFKQIDYTPYDLERPHLIERYERVLFFDPAGIYARIGHKIDPYKRHAGIQMDDLFPKVDGKCACGCDAIPPSGDNWQRKWASDACGSFASDVLSIINNYFGKPTFYISKYYGKQCCECSETTDLELDHIIGVKHGGGGCWLSNYRWVCRGCHRKKTNKDFGFKTRSQLSLL